MGNQIIIYGIFFAAGTAVLSAVSQLFVKYKRSENYVLSGLFFCLGIILFQYGFIFSVKSPHPLIMAYHLTLISLLAPFLYFDYYTMISSDNTYPRHPMKYFLPSLVIFSIDSIFLAAGWYAVIIDSMLSSGNSAPAVVYKVLYCVASAEIVLLLVYLVYTVMSALEREYRSVMLAILIYNITTITLIGIIAAGFIAGSLSIMKSGVFIASMLIILVPVYGQRHPEFVQIIATEAAKRRYERSLLGGLDVDAVLASLEKLMQDEKIFKDETLVLKQVAVRLGISAHQLSELINERKSMHFNSYINRYRIQEAQRILREDPDRSILSITYEIGFNSKSSFYEAFLKCTGKTPQKYRDDISSEK